MGSILFSVCLFVLLVYWDILFRLHLVISPKNTRRFAEKMVYSMSRLVFCISSSFLNHHIAFSSAISEVIPESFVLVANHQSVVDIPTLTYCFRGKSLRFATKESLFSGIPLISLLLRLQRHAAISRNTSKRATISSLKKMSVLATGGHCPVIFPEGTRSRTGALGMFRAGAFRRIVLESALPVVSVAIDGGWLATGARQLTAGLKNRLYRVKIVGIHDSPESREQLSNTLRQIREEIETQQATWRKKTAPNSGAVFMGGHSALS